MIKMTRRALLIGVSALSLVGVPALAAAKVVKIGILAPITGPSAADGEEMVNGAKLAVEELNAAGGTAGFTFELSVGDVGDGSPNNVVTAAERLLGDQDVGAILTGYASSTNFEIQMMAEQEMIYLLSGGSAQTEGIIKPAPENFGTVWSLTPSYAGYNTEIVPVIEALSKSGKLKLPNKKVALIASDNPYSKGIAQGMKVAFETAGWTVTANDLLPVGEINDWRGFLAKVRQDPPAVLINTDYVSANAATFMAQFMEAPSDSLVFIQYAPSVPEFLELTKQNSSGVVYNLLGGILNTPKNPAGGVLVEKYKKAYGKEPGTYGAMLYEEVNVYAQALAKIGDPSDRKAIGAAIGATDKQTSIGKLRFDPATHLSVQSNDGVPLQFYQIRDGKRILFYPDVYATGEFEQPSWMKK